MNHYYSGIFVLLKVLLLSHCAVKMNAIEWSKDLLQICCPFSWWLVEITDPVIDQEIRYECLSKVYNGNFSHGSDEVSSLNIIGKSHPLQGKLLIQSTLPSIILSNCRKPILQRFPHKETTHFSISLDNTCLINTNNELLALTCSIENIQIPSDDRNQKLVSFVHKCCPNLTYYDRKEQQCLPINYSVNPEDSKQAFHFVDDQRIFIYRPDSFHCPQHKLLVEYYINYNVFLSPQEVINGNSQLMDLMIEGKHFSTSEYCLEPLIESEPTSAISNNQHIFVNEHRNHLEDKYLVRVCQDHGNRVCQTMPCIRRCCNEDSEVVAKGNASFYCKSENDTLPSFQSFQSLKTSANFLKPRGKFNL